MEIEDLAGRNFKAHRLSLNGPEEASRAVSPVYFIRGLSGLRSSITPVVIGQSEKLRRA